MTTKGRIEELLSDLGYEWEEMVDPDSEFNIAVPFPRAERGTVHIVRRPGDAATITVVCGSALSGALWKRVATADPVIQQRLLARTKMGLLQSNVGYAFTGDDGDTPPFSRLQTSWPLVVKRLESDALLNAMRRVYNAALMYPVACEEFLAES